MKRKTIAISMIALSMMMACAPQTEKATEKPEESISETAKTEVSKPDTNKSEQLTETSETNIAQTPDIATATVPVDSATDNGFNYMAMGNEPDWSVVVNADNTLIFSTPEVDEIKLSAERSAYAKGSEYFGTYQGKPFYLNINGRTCNDSMADKSYDMRATFEFADKTYKGCAKVK